jgi:hypothetical protein
MSSFQLRSANMNSETYPCLRCNRPLTRGETEVPDCILCGEVARHPAIVEAQPLIGLARDRAVSGKGLVHAAQTGEVTALHRLLALFETLVEDGVVAGDEAVQVIADVDTLKRFVTVAVLTQQRSCEDEETI